MALLLDLSGDILCAVLGDWLSIRDACVLDLAVSANVTVRLHYRQVLKSDTFALSACNLNEPETASAYGLWLIRRQVKVKYLFLTKLLTWSNVEDVIMMSRSKLERLEMSNMGLESHVVSCTALASWLHGCGRLRHFGISIHGTSWSSDFFQEFKHASLRSLTISGDAISSCAIYCIGEHCPNIENLEVSSGIVAGLSAGNVNEHSFGAIKQLDVTYSKISESLLNDILHSCASQLLHLGSERQCANLARCKNLVSLKVDVSPEGSDHLRALFENCSTLEHLCISGHANDACLAALSRSCLNLRKLEMCLNRASRSAVASLFSSLRDLRDLTFNHMWHCEEIISAAALWCHNLRSLTFYVCKLNAGCVARLVRSNPQLRAFDGDLAKMNKKLLEALADCKVLEEIDLSRCDRIADAEAIAILDGCPRLKSVSFGSEKISDWFLLNLITRTRVESLDICIDGLSSAGILMLCRPEVKLKRIALSQRDFEKDLDATMDAAVDQLEKSMLAKGGVFSFD